jgi:hypothetical protein
LKSQQKRSSDLDFNLKINNTSASRGALFYLKYFESRLHQNVVDSFKRRRQVVFAHHFAQVNFYIATNG